MSVVIHDEREWRENRPGSRVRLLVDPTGAVTRLGLVDQEVAPGVGAPDHTHDYDEAITVIEGSAEIWIAGERWEAGPGTTAFIPAGAVHGFRNSGDGQLRVQATMNANELRATFVSPSGGTAPGS